MGCILLNEFLPRGGAAPRLRARPGRRSSGASAISSARRRRPSPPRRRHRPQGDLGLHRLPDQRPQRHQARLPGARQPSSPRPRPPSSPSSGATTTGTATAASATAATATTAAGRRSPRRWPTHYGLKAGDRVLDVGCGKAFLLYDLTQVVPGLEVARHRRLRVRDRAREGGGRATACDVGSASRRCPTRTTASTWSSRSTRCTTSRLRPRQRPARDRARRREHKYVVRRVLPQRGGEGEPPLLAAHLRGVLHAAGVGVVVRAHAATPAITRSSTSSSSMKAAILVAQDAALGHRRGRACRRARRRPGAGQGRLQRHLRLAAGRDRRRQGPRPVPAAPAGPRGLGRGAGGRPRRVDRRAPATASCCTGARAPASQSPPARLPLGRPEAERRLGHHLQRAGRRVREPRDARSRTTSTASSRRCWAARSPPASASSHNDAQVKIGESVVVFGAGGVGLSVVQGAALAGAHPIVAVDLHDNKLELAGAPGRDPPAERLGRGRRGGRRRHRRTGRRGRRRRQHRRARGHRARLRARPARAGARSWSASRARATTPRRSTRCRCTSARC